MEEIDQDLTISEIVELTGAARHFVSGWIRDRRLPAEKRRGEWKVRQEDFERFYRARGMVLKKEIREIKQNVEARAH